MSTSQQIQSKNIPPIAWGLIGSSNGLQTSVAGIDLQLKQATIFDLPSNIAVVLPLPETQERIPLYCVSRVKVGQYQLNAIAQYVSVKQQGSHRSGTFFGSFIYSANSTFRENSAAYLRQSLFGLSKYQLDNFIDANTNAYKTDIKDKACPRLSNFEIIVDALQAAQASILSQSNETIIFIDASNIEQGEEETLSLILSLGLNNFHDHIYFSESKNICNKFKQIDANYFTFEQISKSKGFYKELLLLFNNIKKYAKEIEMKLEEVQKEFSSYKQQFNDLLTQNINQQKIEFQNQYQMRINALEQEKETLEKLALENQNYANKYVNLVGRFNQLYKDIRQDEQSDEIISISEELNNLRETVENQQAKISTLQSKCKAEGNETQKISNEFKIQFFKEKQKNKLTLISFSVFSVILLCYIGYLTFSDNSDKYQSDINEYKNKINKLEGELKKIQSENDKLELEIKANKRAQDNQDNRLEGVDKNTSNPVKK